jgi:DNA polymerase-3 subunit epsilon
MMQGDFPLYTKRKLEEIYSRWNAKKVAERQAKPAQPKPVDSQAKVQAKPIDTQSKPAAAQQTNTNQAKKEFNKPDDRNNQQNRPFKKDEPAKPVNDDMLKMLTDKFKKGL